MIVPPRGLHSRPPFVWRMCRLCLPQVIKNGVRVALLPLLHERVRSALRLQLVEIPQHLTQNVNRQLANNQEQMVDLGGLRPPAGIGPGGPGKCSIIQTF